MQNLISQHLPAILGCGSEIFISDNSTLWHFQHIFHKQLTFARVSSRVLYSFSNTASLVSADLHLSTHVGCELAKPGSSPGPSSPEQHKGSCWQESSAKMSPCVCSSDLISVAKSSEDTIFWAQNSTPWFSSQPTSGLWPQHQQNLGNHWIIQQLLFQ